MGEFGRRRVIEELEWRHEAPKLLAAYESLVPKDQSREARSVKSSAHPSGA
jgi:hypothetical protein